MKFGVSLFFSVFLGLVVLLMGEYVNPPVEKPCKKCHFSYAHNFTDPEVIPLLRGVWSHRSFLRGSPLLAELRDVLLRMTAADSGYLAQLAFIHSYWASTLLSGAQCYPSLCQFSKVIKQTVEYECKKEDSILVENAYRITELMYSTCSLLRYAVLKTIGCKGIPEPEDVDTDCNEGNLVYEAEEYWNLVGSNVPCALRQLFQRLYHSSKFWERAHAAVLAFSLSPLQKHFFQIEQMGNNLNMLNIFAKSRKLKRCCCGTLGNRMRNYCLASNQTAYNNMDAFIKQSLREDCSDEHH